MINFLKNLKNSSENWLKLRGGKPFSGGETIFRGGNHFQGGKPFSGGETIFRGGNHFQGGGGGKCPPPLNHPKKKNPCKSIFTNMLKVALKNL